ncbi:hypothetical protein FIBSPDRAFT_886899 [Athelia psychrophila]|uniref:Uncharacterized protein n=1 Tax=Athelia psychrophila TaxID=1759441 RepID=A0A166QCN0_9AGAM|nr:hypothetical protein FIBSPDRAFT_886899 [Fibularhizoctonia sp. CBS 109695]
MNDEPTLTAEQIFLVNNIQHHAWVLAVAYSEMCRFSADDAQFKLEPLIQLSFEKNYLPTEAALGVSLSIPVGLWKIFQQYDIFDPPSSQISLEDRLRAYGEIIKTYPSNGNVPTKSEMSFDKSTVDDLAAVECRRLCLVQKQGIYSTSGATPLTTQNGAGDGDSVAGSQETSTTLKATSASTTGAVSTTKAFGMPDVDVIIDVDSMIDAASMIAGVSTTDAASTTAGASMNDAAATFQVAATSEGVANTDAAATAATVNATAAPGAFDTVWTTDVALTTEAVQSVSNLTFGKRRRPRSPSVEEIPYIKGKASDANSIANMMEQAMKRGPWIERIRTPRARSAEPKSHTMACQACYVRKQKCSTNGKTRMSKKAKVDKAASALQFKVKSEMTGPTSEAEWPGLSSQEPKNDTSDLVTDLPAQSEMTGPTSEAEWPGLSSQEPKNDTTDLVTDLPAQSEMTGPPSEAEGPGLSSQGTADDTTDPASPSPEIEVDDSEHGPRMLAESEGLILLASNACLKKQVEVLLKVAREQGELSQALSARVADLEGQMKCLRELQNPLAMSVLPGTSGGFSEDMTVLGAGDLFGAVAPMSVEDEPESMSFFADNRVIAVSPTPPPSPGTYLGTMYAATYLTTPLYSNNRVTKVHVIVAQSMHFQNRQDLFGSSQGPARAVLASSPRYSFGSFKRLFSALPENRPKKWVALEAGSGVQSSMCTQVLSLVVRIHVERVYPRIQRHEPLNSDVRRRFRAARVGLWDVNDPPAAGYTLEALSVRVGWSTREVGWAAHGARGRALVRDVGFVLCEDVRGLWVDVDHRLACCARLVHAFPTPPRPSLTMVVGISAGLNSALAVVFGSRILRCLFLRSSILPMGWTASRESLGCAPYPYTGMTIFYTRVRDGDDQQAIQPYIATFEAQTARVRVVIQPSTKALGVPMQLILASLSL